MNCLKFSRINAEVQLHKKLVANPKEKYMESLSVECQDLFKTNTYIHKINHFYVLLNIDLIRKC